MMLTDNRKPAWSFYPGWVALSVISIPLGWSLTWAIVSRIVQVVGGRIQVAGQSHITEDFIYRFVLLPVLGLLLGVLQYILLRRYLPRMGWWIAATVLGWVVPVILLSFLSSVGLYPAVGVDPVWSGALGLVLLLGAPVGLCQWFVLRRRIHRDADAASPADSVIDRSLCVVDCRWSSRSFNLVFPKPISLKEKT